MIASVVLADCGPIPHIGTLLNMRHQIKVVSCPFSVGKMIKLLENDPQPNGLVCPYDDLLSRRVQDFVQMIRQDFHSKATIIMIVPYQGTPVDTKILLLDLKAKGVYPVAYLEGMGAGVARTIAERIKPVSTGACTCLSLERRERRRNEKELVVVCERNIFLPPRLSELMMYLKEKAGKPIPKQDLEKYLRTLGYTGRLSDLLTRLRFALLEHRDGERLARTITQVGETITFRPDHFYSEPE